MARFSFFSSSWKGLRMSGLSSSPSGLACAERSVLLAGAWGAGSDVVWEGLSAGGVADGRGMWLSSCAAGGGAAVVAARVVAASSASGDDIHSKVFPKKISDRPFDCDVVINREPVNYSTRSFR